MREIAAEKQRRLEEDAEAMAAEEERLRAQEVQRELEAQQVASPSHVARLVSIAEQPAPAPHLAHPEEYAALRIVPVNVPRVSRYCEHFSDGFDSRRQWRLRRSGSGRRRFRGSWRRTRFCAHTIGALIVRLAIVSLALPHEHCLSS